MKEKVKIQRTRIICFIELLLVYSWLTILAPLSVTDTYYSVYLVCAVVGLLCLVDNHKRVQGRDTCNANVAVLAIFAILFSLAVILGNYELFEPFSVLQNLFDAVCTLLGGFVVGYNILLCLLNRLPLGRDLSERKHSLQVFFFVFASIAIIDLVYLLFVQYPGTLITDSFTTLAQLMGDEPYDNTMPFWHTVTVKVFVEIGLVLFGNMTDAVAFFHGVQILFMAACFAYVIVTMYQMGVPKPFMVAVYAIFAFMPYNIVYSVTLWKDIPFAGAGALFVTAFYRLLKNIGKSRKLNYTVFTLGALGFSLWRTNGWYAFLATVLVMLFLLRKQNKKLLMIMAVVLVFCWVLINPVLDAMNVGETNLVEAFAVPMQQIARVVSNERELTAEEAAMLSSIFDLEQMKALYNPLTVDPVKFETFYYDQVDYIVENIGSYLKLYIQLGLRYPGDYLKAWVDETKGYWNGGYFFWIYTRTVDDNIYGIELTMGNNLISRLYNAVFRYLEKPAILQPLTSIGLHVWVLIACCVINALKKRKEILIAIPMLVLVVGLWLGTPVYSEFRYAYPIFLTLPLILASTLYHVEEPASI